MPRTSLHVLRGEAGDHPGLRRAGHGADDDRVEEDAQLGLLLGDLVGPAGEAEPAERMVGGAGGIAYGLPPASSTDVSASSQLFRIPMSKPDGSSRTSAPRIRERRMFPTLS